METQVVFKMRYAAQLMDMGHKVVEILPNPYSPKFKMWVFEVDETFEEDLNKLRRKE